MVEKIYDLRAKAPVRDIAFSAQQYLATSLAKYAANQAKCLGINCVGFTGGVAYNNQMTSVIERVVVDEGLHFVVPVQVPCGDGGSSFGQACGASLMFSKK
jgi:hydrogenase maturation protein HypF